MIVRFLSAAAVAVALLASAAAAAPPAAGPSQQTREDTRSRPRPSASPTAPPELAQLRPRAIGPAISGGRVAAVAGSDRDPALYYVGGAGGGLFKSTNGGMSFSSVWDDQPFGAIGAIAIDPKDDAHVWVGTGEGNPRNDVSYGNGIYETRDGGKHWKHRGLTATSAIPKILIDPRDPKHLVVAALGDIWTDSTERGVYRSTDGGATWTKTLYLDPATGAADLASDPSDPNTIYAAMWRFRRQPWIAESGGGKSGLYRSRDGGATWTRISGNGFAADPVGRIGVAIAPGHPKRVYAVVQSRDGVIWRSDDGGDHWQLVSRDSTPGQRPFYFSHLIVDPKKQDHVIAVSMYLTESKNAGKTWKHWVSNVHVDNHAIWWSHDGQRVIEGNDGGAILSLDGGGSWSQLLRIPLAAIYHIGWDNQNPYTICGGLQDNSSWCAPANSRNGIGILDRDWTAIAGGDGMYAIPDPRDPSLVWTNTQDGVLTIYDAKARQSYDVSPWPRDVFTSRTSFGQTPYRFNWNAPLAFSRDGGTAYFGGNVVFKTVDRGRTWTPISPDLTRNEKAHQVASGGPITLDVSGAEYYDTLLALAPSMKDDGVIWAGADDGLLWLTRDGGTTWKNVTPPFWPKYGRIDAIDASPYAAGTAFAVFDRHDLGDRKPYVVRTDDFGATWHALGGLPPDAHARVVRQDPRNANLLYVGTENALWRSYDAGRRWEKTKGLPPVPIYDVNVHPVANDVVVATHGRGFYVLDDAAALQQLAAARSANVTMFDIRPGVLWSQWQPIETGDGGALGADVYVGPNPPGPIVVAFYLKHKAKERPWIEIVDASGRVVRHLRGAYPSGDTGFKPFVTNDAGVNRVVWDGTEDPPARWHGTTRQNAGPASGPEALAGTYTARLHVDGTTLEKPFELKDDPSLAFNASDRAARHAYLATVLGWYDVVDRALDEIDKRRRSLRTKNDAASRAQDAQLASLRAELTSDPQHDEDGIGKPDRLREQIGALAGPLGGSLQPPFSQHQAALDALRPTVEAELRRVAGVLGPAYLPPKAVLPIVPASAPSSPAPSPSP